MLKEIILKDIKHNILSIRLHILFILIMIVFAYGSISFISHFKDEDKSSKQTYQSYVDGMRRDAEKNLTNLATGYRVLFSSPRSNSFLTDAKEKHLPNAFGMTAFNVFFFTVKWGSVNPFLNVFTELSWGMIISLIISFTVFLLTFDSISGEKEAKTLAITFANPVSKGTYLFGKYLSAIITCLIVLLPGMCVSLIILLMSKIVTFDATLIAEILGFIFTVILFVACIAACGIFCSVITKSSNISLLIALSMWLFFFVLIPNTAIFWADKFFPIEKIDVVNEREAKAAEALNRDAPPGSWNSSTEQPFIPEHKLRAAIQTKLLMSDKQIKDAYYNDMIRQYKKVELLTCVSPVCMFEYMSEGVVGGGYIKFQKYWDDLHIYQSQLLTFFKEMDAKDPESPHWYNPWEDYSTSKKPVDFNKVPLFIERSPSFSMRFHAIVKFFIFFVIYTSAMFFISYTRFKKYDVR
jgi:ABC-type transport system involved in multi-copper enzyme maturation permease subunit